MSVVLDVMREMISQEVRKVLVERYGTKLGEFVKSEVDKVDGEICAMLSGVESQPQQPPIAKQQPVQQPPQTNSRPINLPTAEVLSNAHGEFVLNAAIPFAGLECLISEQLDSANVAVKERMMQKTTIKDDQTYDCSAETVKDQHNGCYEESSSDMICPTEAEDHYMRVVREKICEGLIIDASEEDEDPVNDDISDAVRKTQDALFVSREMLAIGKKFKDDITPQHIADAKQRNADLVRRNKNLKGIVEVIGDYFAEGAADSFINIEPRYTPGLIRWKL